MAAAGGDCHTAAVGEDGTLLVRDLDFYLDEDFRGQKKVKNKSNPLQS